MQRTCRFAISAFVGALFCAIAPGCTTISVPAGGVGAVTVVEGGLVKTMEFADGLTLDLQITEKDVPAGEALFPHVLTVGKFSHVLGSGFTSRSNIYYEERIGPGGQDTFKCGDRQFRVTWHSEGALYLPRKGRSIFTVTVEQTRE